MRVVRRAVLKLSKKKWGTLTSERGAIGAEIETPKALRGRGLGRGCLLPQPTTQFGERRKLSQRGLERNPSRN